MSLNKFKQSIEITPVEGNRTYLSANYRGCKYGQSYRNTVNTIENMVNNFVCFYYPIVEERTN